MTATQTPNPEWWEAAKAGVCSHGGHGYDGETCSDALAGRVDALREEGLTELAAAGQAAEEQGFTGTILMRPEGGRQQVLEYRAGFCTDRYDTKAGEQI